MIQFNIDLTPFITAIISVLVSLSVLVFTLERNKKLQAETAFFNLLTGIRNLVINTKGNVTVKNSSIISGLQGNDYLYAANIELQSRVNSGFAKMFDNDISLDEKKKSTFPFGLSK
jgi:hypothetical protein